MPRSGRDFDGRTSRISLSTCSSSPGRTGRGQLRSSKPTPENTVRRAELAVNDETHRQRRGVPAARREPAKYRLAGGFFVEMVRLRIELRGERDQLVLFHPQPTRAI